MARVSASARNGGEPEIARWYNNKETAISLRFDDSSWSPMSTS